MMPYPPSLAPDILARTFRGASGEHAVLPADAKAFLDACQADGVGVRGWELWLVDHAFDAGTKAPRRSLGAWCGLIPLRAQALPAIIGGSGDLATTRRQIAELDLDGMIDEPWRAAIRFHITLHD
jgi:hypothetical protein